MNRLSFLTAATLTAGLLASGCQTTSNVREVVRYDTVYVEVEAPTVDLAAAETPAAGLPEIEAGRFDFGKMWTFDNPPLDYFREDYGFEPDQAWFDKARLGALRLSNCSASFVSPNGLVMTNHHCAREALTAVSEPGENLLDNGFYAPSLATERPVEDAYADQLISITDVTNEIRAAEALVQTASKRVDVRKQTIDAIESRMTEEAGGEDAGFQTEIIALYNGGQYSAYLFKRYDDLRLVQAPELQIAYFGGDPDNFTYPRYNLDMSFFRIYEDGEPATPDIYFKWSPTGASEGEAVFVVGNPGSTNRLQTIAELEYRRDYEDPIILNLLESRSDAMSAFLAEDPAAAEDLDLVNSIFSLENSIKSRTGVLKGLNDPMLMARKQTAEQKLIDAISADSALATRYAGLFDETAELQDELAEMASAFGAFIVNPSAEIYSTVVIRAALGVLYSAQIRAGVPEDALADFRDQILEVEPYPVGLEKHLLKARLDDLVKYLGPDDSRVVRILAGRSTEQTARHIAENTSVLDTVAFRSMLPDFIQSADAAVDLGLVIGDGLSSLQQVAGSINARQTEISGEISRARFEIYGTSFPPDASFSLRISDGIVKSYEYNGTMAPAFTTFYGLYDRYYSHGGEQEGADWDLPESWLDPASGLDRSVSVNLVTTNDIIGGNSGSPLLNTKLEIVGLVFDGNIESLPGEFIYSDEAARTVAVDSRGIIEALDEMYDADRIVLELLRGDLYETEAAADRAR